MRTPTSLPPDLGTEIPGPQSRALSKRLEVSESRNVTCLRPEPPIFWERASGSNVWDVDGNRFVDLGAAFGVANVGHAHPRVVNAIREQSEVLLHGMGDVHPPRVKVDLLDALVSLFPGRKPARAILGSSGSDAVESALKTAMLHTGRAGVVAFEGAYHGLSIGALDTTWRQEFRAPFEARLPTATSFAAFGDADAVEAIARIQGDEIGAVLVEPIQGRGGERIPPDGFLGRLRQLCDERGWLLIFDEIYTGFGRTGDLFGCEHEGVVPDLMCVGKGLASGFPISACVGRRDVMDAWPTSDGEALHTQTFLGHPVGCAAALASLSVIEEDKLVDRSAQTGKAALASLQQSCSPLERVAEVRGRGLMIGIECRDGETARAACKESLRRGVILLPSGDDGRVLSVTPPLSIEPSILDSALRIVVESLE